jgi:hypothetical protein
MVLYFIFGISLALLILAATKRIAKTWKVLLVLAAAAISVVGWATWPDQRFLSTDAWHDTTPLREAVLFALMLAGMAARTLSVAIEQRRVAASTSADGSPPPVRLEAWDFLYPFLVSFITFGAVIEFVGAEPLKIPQLILAFQNGFFWQTVVNRSP